MNDNGYINANHISKMIVTFGKYKGKSVEHMMGDKNTIIG